MEFLDFAKSLNITLPIVVLEPNDINKALPLLRFPLDEQAIQESLAGENGKSYNMKGYSYQAHIDRMNLVFGVNWRYEMLNEKVDEVTSWNNRRSYYCQGDMVISIGQYRRNEDTRRFEWIPVYSTQSVPTGHENTECDSARKGAMTKGIKRATSILGVGADAYLGILDDDLSTGVQLDQEQERGKFGGRKERLQKAVEWDQQQINELEYNGLMIIAEKKGLTSDKLRSFYSANSNGEIADEPCMLRKGDLANVKIMISSLPDYVEGAERKETQPENEQTEGKRDWPTSIEEMLLINNEVLREIAAEFSVQVPQDITARNKGNLCRTLWTLMENIRKAAGS